MLQKKTTAKLMAGLCATSLAFLGVFTTSNVATADESQNADLSVEAVTGSFINNDTFVYLSPYKTNDFKVTLKNAGPDAAKNTIITLEYGPGNMAEKWKFPEGAACKYTHKSDSNIHSVIECNVGDLASGTVKEYSFEFTGPAEGAKGGESDGITVSVASDTPDNNPTNNKQEPTIIVPGTNAKEVTTNIVINKTVDKSEAKVGDTLEYTMTIRNDGPVMVDEILLDDISNGDMCTGMKAENIKFSPEWLGKDHIELECDYLTFDAAKTNEKKLEKIDDKYKNYHDNQIGIYGAYILPGQTATLKYEYAIPADTKPGKFENILFNLHADTNPNTPAVAETDVKAAVDISLKATSSPEKAITPGDEAKYTFEVANSGPSDAPAAKVEGTLPTGLSEAKVDCGTPDVSATIDTNSHTFTCEYKELKKDEKHTVTVSGKVAEDASGKLEIPAKVSLTEEAAKNTVETNPDNNDATASTQIQVLDLAVEATVKTESPVAGGTVEYEVKVSNHGIAGAEAAKLTGTLPEGLTIKEVKCPQGGEPVISEDTRTFTCTYKNVAPAKDASTPTAVDTVTLVADISKDAKGKLSFSAEVASTASADGKTTPESALENNKASVETEIGAAPTEEKPAPGGDEKPAPGGDEKPAPGTDKPAPGGDEKPAPGGDEKPAPGTDKPAPGGDEKPAPGTDKPAPGGEEKPAPGDDEKPAPGTDKPAPGGIDKPAPGDEKPAPGVDNPAAQPAPGSNEKPAPSTDKPAAGKENPIPSSANQPMLADTGANIGAPLLISVLLLSCGIAVRLSTRKSSRRQNS